MRFFFDNCISPRLARAINELDVRHKVIHLKDRFPPNTPDVEWIAKLGAEGDWVVVSGDLQIHRRPAEREAWKRARMTVFFMAHGFSPSRNDKHAGDWWWEQVKWLINKWPLIISQTEKVAPGAAFIVPKTGSKLRQA